MMLLREILCFVALATGGFCMQDAWRPVVKEKRLPSVRTVFGGTNADEFCPTEADFKPCTCDEEGISCMYAANGKELQRAFQSKSPSYEHRELFIQRSGVEAINASAFGDYVFQQVNIDLNERLQTFDVSSLRKSKDLLVILSLYGNRLSALDFATLANFKLLQRLNLGGNLFTSIKERDMAPLKSLVELSLAENPIEKIEPLAFSQMSNLQKLFLYGTKLKQLDNNVLSIEYQRQLPFVNLRKSGITDVGRRAFGQTTLFGVIDMRLNNLTTLPESPFKDLVNRLYRLSMNQQGGFILLQGNPINCNDCDNSWIPASRYFSNVYVDMVCSDGRKASQLGPLDFRHC